MRASASALATGLCGSAPSSSKADEDLAVRVPAIKSGVRRTFGTAPFTQRRILGRQVRQAPGETAYDLAGQPATAVVGGSQSHAIQREFKRNETCVSRVYHARWLAITHQSEKRHQ